MKKDISRIHVKMLLDELIKDRDTIRTNGKDISIMHYILSNSSMNVRYSECVKDICEKMNIIYKTENINDHKNFKALSNSIANSNSTGILYSCPFIYDGFVGQLLKRIPPNKDIECISPTVYGEYMCNVSHKVKPCISQIIAQLMILHGRVDEMQKMVVITPKTEYFNTRKVCSTIHNSYNVTFIPITSENVIKEMYDADIIISIASNSPVRVLNTDKEYPTLGDALVIDFGYSPSGSPSIDRAFFDKRTIFYNLSNSLMEMYVISAIKNLFNILK